jgi:hypothetical protein
MAATYDKSHRITDIRPTDCVFIHFARGGESGYVASGINAHKLDPQRVGPFLVVEMCGPNAGRVDTHTKRLENMACHQHSPLD